MSYQMLVCGSRTFDQYAEMKSVLDCLVAIKGHPEVIIHGGAHGADSLASRYAYERKIDLHIEGAQWGTYGNLAGPKRNTRMCSMLMPNDEVFAFVDKPLEQSRGTAHMISLVEARGFIPCIGVFPGR